MTTPVKSGSLWTLLLAFLSAAPVALALDFSNGDLEGNLDVTISVGGSYRLSGPSDQLIGLDNWIKRNPEQAASGNIPTPDEGGPQYSVNADDGNLNYKKGWYSAPVLLSADLEFRYKNSGAFFRANAFYDYINEEKDRERTPLTPDALDRVGSRFDMLDAYFWTNLEMGDMPLNFRIGRQVLNWGESTFIQNGINAINPVDVSKLRLPGSELRDALLPVWMASGSLAVTENVTLEAFYQFKWKEIIIDPPGTYFSTNDFVGRGGQSVYLGFGGLGDDTPLGAIPRGPTNKPSDSGQFGIAARIYAPELGGTEFGIFFLNTHSRLPVLSAMTPTDPISTTYVQQTAGALAEANIAPAMIAFGISPEVIPVVLPNLVGAALLGVPVEGLPASLAPYAPFYPAAQDVASGAGRLGLLQSAATGRYLVEYPEDIQLVGFSFNTDVGTTGISLQGEVSYKWDQPLQIDDVELLFAALSAVNPGFGDVNQIGDFLGQLGTYVKGWREEEVWQAQATATKVFGPMLGADQAVFLIEGGMTYVPGLPGKDDLRFDAPGTYVGGNPDATDDGLQPDTEPASAFADSTSWGYRAVAKLDYLNAFMSTNLSPIIQFAHDVSGTTPSPIVNFVEGRKSLTLALQATYQNSWAANISYTNYFGAGRYNLIHDRDFVSVTVKYSF
ncbi:MAG: DUF1302 domain-containing protein [Puniceicoccaceae bacterium]